MFRALVYFVCAAATAQAAVTRIDLTFRDNVKGLADEVTYGKVYFAVDPKLAPNRIIRDIDLAPRNKQGSVEFSAVTVTSYGLPNTALDSEGVTMASGAGPGTTEISPALESNVME